MTALRVVKVGGSLFSYEGLATALRRWLIQQPPLTTLLFAGGGGLADVIRAADARHGLGEEASHGLCSDALSVSARLLSALLPEARLEAAVAALPECRGTLIFDPAPYLRHEDSLHPRPLPHAWQVTSDSIAARLAEHLAAEELVLIKSASGTGYATRAAAAQAGYVDGYFPLAAQRLARVRWVNLRDPQFEESLLG